MDLSRRILALSWVSTNSEDLQTHQSDAFKVIKQSKTTKYMSASTRVALAPSDSVRIARELQGMTQAELAKASGIPHPTISSIENGRVILGAERAE